jgi:L-rhamnose isomerase
MDLQVVYQCCLEDSRYHDTEVVSQKSGKLLFKNNSLQKLHLGAHQDETIIK